MIVCGLLDEGFNPTKLVVDIVDRVLAFTFCLPGDDSDDDYDDDDNVDDDNNDYDDDDDDDANDDNDDNDDASK